MFSQQLIHLFTFVLVICDVLCTPVTTPVPTITPLGSPCFDESTCGIEAACGYEHKCHCPLGFIPEVDGVNCQQFNCLKDADCTRFSNHTVCMVITGMCACLPGYEMDYDSTACVPESALIGGNCTTRSDCGLNAVCTSGHCSCNFPTVITENGQDCVNTCSNDDQCKKIDAHLRCNINSTFCECSPGFRVNIERKACTVNSGFHQKFNLNIVIGSLLFWFGLWQITKTY